LSTARARRPSLSSYPPTASPFPASSASALLSLEGGSTEFSLHEHALNTHPCPHVRKILRRCSHPQHLKPQHHQLAHHPPPTRSLLAQIEMLHYSNKVQELKDSQKATDEKKDRNKEKYAQASQNLRDRTNQLMSTFAHAEQLRQKLLTQVGSGAWCSSIFQQCVAFLESTRRKYIHMVCFLWFKISLSGRCVFRTYVGRILVWKHGAGLGLTDKSFNTRFLCSPRHLAPRAVVLTFCANAVVLSVGAYPCSFPAAFAVMTACQRGGSIRQQHSRTHTPPDNRRALL